MRQVNDGTDGHPTVTQTCSTYYAGSANEQLGCHTQCCIKTVIRTHRPSFVSAQVSPSFSFGPAEHTFINSF